MVGKLWKALVRVSCLKLKKKTQMESVGFFLSKRRVGASIHTILIKAWAVMYIWKKLPWTTLLKTNNPYIPIYLSVCLFVVEIAIFPFSVCFSIILLSFLFPSLQYSPKWILREITFFSNPSTAVLWTNSQSHPSELEFLWTDILLWKWAMSNADNWMLLVHMLYRAYNLQLCDPGPERR